MCSRCVDADVILESEREEYERIMRSLDAFDSGEGDR